LEYHHTNKTIKGTKEHLLNGQQEETETTCLDKEQRKVMQKSEW
jgi:hypothetical protein